MPTPKEGESQQDFVSRCIPIVLDEGTAKDQEQAAAVCYSMWRDRDKAMTNELKTLSKTDEEIRVGNYIVLYGGKDLTGEHFTKNTNLESEYTKTGMLYVDWEHGLDDDEESPQYDDILGYVDWKTAKKDDKGTWVERVLSRRNQYFEFIQPLIEAGMVGTSSEAVPGLVEKTADGEIVRWGLKRDTITVQPAEPRMMTDNVINAIKALSEFQPHLKALLTDGATVDEGNNVGGETDKNQAEETAEAERRKNTMNFTSEQTAYIDEQIKKALAEQEIREAPQEEATDKSVSEQLEILTDLIQKAPNLRGDYVAPDSEKDHPEVKSFGDFLVAVRQGNEKRLQSVYKTAMTGETGAQGGYLIPTEYGDVITAQANELSVLRKAGATIVPMARRTREVPLGDFETAPSAGDTAYAFGVVARWTEEAASINESEPRFKLMTLVAHKLAAYSLASSEVREDANESIDGLVATAFSRAIAAQENYQFFRGNGVGKPRGIRESGAISDQTRSAASTVALADLALMMSAFMPTSLDSGSYAWFINPAVLQELIALVSSPLSWMPDVRGARVPMQLMGGNLYITGALPGLNTAGDIMLIDPKYYYIGDRTGIDIAISEHYKFVNDQLTWRVRKRVEGQPILDSTVTLENASTTVSPYVGLAAG